MTKRGFPASPILGAAAALIDEASTSLVTRETRFRHTFEAQSLISTRRPNSRAGVSTSLSSLPLPRPWRSVASYSRSCCEDIPLPLAAG